MRPSTAWPAPERVHNAISRASSGSSTGMLEAVRHPTIRRLKTSETNAVNAIPDQVGRYVRSTTRSWFGPAALNSRPTRSGGRVGLGRDERLSAANPLKPSDSHQPFDPATPHVAALAAQLVPYLAGPVHAAADSRIPGSIAACFTQPRNVSGTTPTRGPIRFTRRSASALDLRTSTRQPFAAPVHAARSDTSSVLA